MESAGADEADVGAGALLKAAPLSGRGGHGRVGGPDGAPVSGQGGHGREGVSEEPSDGSSFLGCSSLLSRSK